MFDLHDRLPLRPHQIRRVEDVVDLVDKSLAENLSLGRLASHAAFSPFHFHRLFFDWTGETTNQFVRRRRLETAAGRLRHCPGETIVNVAFQCGFGSAQAFARAFRQHFKMSPTEWRQSGCGRWRVAPVQGASEIGRQVEIRHRAPCEVVYQRVRGDYKETTTPLWRRMPAWIERMCLEEAPRLSMGLDDPTIAAAGRCRLDACVEVPEGWLDPDRGAAHRTLPGGAYAVMRYVGPMPELHRGWAALLQEWLPDSTYTLADGPFFARHLPRVSAPDDASLDCELYMPVR